MIHTLIESLPTTAYLHFEATRVSDGNVQVDYELVLPLDEVDCRGTFDHKGRKSRPKSHAIVWLDTTNSRRIPLGRTMVGTSDPEYPFHSAYPNEISLPFRDGAHCGWDNQKLGGLPVIYSKDGKHWKVSKPPEKDATLDS